MNRLFLLVAFLVCLIGTSSAKTDPALQQTLLSAIQRSDLTSNQTAPFQMEVDFAAQFTSLAHGHLTLKWAARDRWRREITVGSFKQVEIRNGEWKYTTRNASFTPSRIPELITLLGLNSYSLPWKGTKEKHRSVKGMDEDCIRADQLDDTTKPPRPMNIDHEFCLSSGSDDIASDEWTEGPGQNRRKEYGDYVDFASHRYPRHFRFLVNGSNAITADVVSLAPATFDEAQFKPQPDALVRRECEGMRHPVPINQPEVDFSAAARQNGGGTLVVAMTVLTDGSVDNVQLTGSTEIPLDANTLRTLRSYRFKPAMCGTEPVVSDITVEIQYHLN